MSHSTKMRLFVKSKVEDTESNNPKPEPSTFCQHCNDEEEDEKEPEFESPFLALAPVLKAYQWLGVFNVAFDAKCVSFECRPLRLAYSLALNAVVALASALAAHRWLAQEEGVGLERLRLEVGRTFTGTDLVAMGAFAMMILVRVDTYKVHILSFGI